MSPGSFVALPMAAAAARRDAEVGSPVPKEKTENTESVPPQGLQVTWDSPATLPTKVLDTGDFTNTRNHRGASSRHVSDI